MHRIRPPTPHLDRTAHNSTYGPWRLLALPADKGFLVADRAYESNETRQLALDLGYTPVIPPKSNRRHPWDYNHQINKRRNDIKRLFRWLKAYPPHVSGAASNRRVDRPGGGG